jgi:DeoR/GlpR family transcriptional regulator of sugar metabolism
MTNQQRTDSIEHHLREHKYADLHTLAERFDASLSTVRRALDALELRGVVRRHHGGASLVDTDAFAQEYDFISRNQRHPEEKFTIARLVAEQVQPGMTVILDGGSIYSRLGVLVGPLCEQSFEQAHADLAILGGAGITENGIWNHNALIVAAQRKMIAAAERTIFALDNSKFGRKALNLTTPFDPRFTIVTETRPTPAVARAINAAGAQLTLAGK